MIFKLLNRNFTFLASYCDSRKFGSRPLTDTYGFKIIDKFPERSRYIYAHEIAGYTETIKT